MSGRGTHELGAQARTSRGRTPGLRARLAHDYAAAYGRDPRYDCLDWLERFGRWIGSLSVDEHREVLRSVPQFARALGLPYDGTVKGARSRYRDQFVRSLGYLQRMGWVESVEAVYEPNGEGRGILVRLPAGVAQSVRAAES
jgi:hypothetical protein